MIPGNDLIGQNARLRTADAFPVVASLPPENSYFSEGEKRRPGMRLLFAGYQNARKGLFDGRLVNAFCLVLGITLYNIKERKLINQSNDKTDKITHSRQTVMSPNALTRR